ncbi:MAG: PstS family phosphate ABC transporter substrate-binding protein [Ilyomonas sp.]
MNFIKKAFLPLSVLIVLNSCSTKDDNNDKDQTVSISFSGAFALYPLAQKWAEEYNKTHPNIRFDIQAGGAGKGLTDALSGAVDVGMFSREITDAEKAKGVWWISLCKDAVLPTVNSSNPDINTLRTQGLTKEQFESIFTNKQPQTWESLLRLPSKSSNKISVYTRADAAGAADSWAAFFGKKQENLQGIGVSGDPGVADAVRKDKNGIGYNNTLFVFDINSGKKNPGIEVAPIDVNGNGKIDEDENVYTDLKTFLEAVNNGKFPSPPARDLYFITKGKPVKKEVTDFFKWVLTDGQKYVQSAGYVPLPANTIDEQKSKLDQ